MVFSSNVFLFIFLPLVLCIYFLINPRFKNAWLLIASLFFYFYGEGKFVIVLLASVSINYIFGLLVSLVRNKALFVRRLTISLGIVANLSLLFWYKYLDFAINTTNSLFGAHLPLAHIALPIGISFFTFQGLTYIIDLYWGNVEVQKNPLKVALYISLFPQLVAGPIVRYKDINEQIDSRKVTLSGFAEGVGRFAIGLGKKVIIADTVAVVADSIFNTPFSEHTALTAWLGVICYTLQIYFDFSGYSDMAIGLGKMFGFTFKENFNYPYISKSITEFWRRWHISLSSFFKDYVYIPLGGNRKGNVYIHLFIVFFLTGLWHGAAWNFVIWGFWHGAFIIIERLGKNYLGDRIKIPNAVKHIYLLLVVVIGWVLFRADNLTYALGYLKIMFGFLTPVNVGFTTSYYMDNFLVFVLLLGVIGSTNIGGLVKDRINLLNANAYTAIRNIYVMLILLVSAMFVMSSTFSPFIYFRF